MQSLLSYLLTATATLLAIPATVLLAEVISCIAGFRRQSPLKGADSYPRIAVVVPAHNENTGLLPTVADIKAQLRKGDRLIVVADNCTDTVG